MIEVIGTLEPQDYLRAQYLHIRPRLVFKVLGALILLMTIWAVWFSFFGGGSDQLSWSDSLLPAAVVYFILHFLVYIPWKTRRIYDDESTNCVLRNRRHFDRPDICQESQRMESTPANNSTEPFAL